MRLALSGDMRVEFSDALAEAAVQPRIDRDEDGVGALFHATRDELTDRGLWSDAARPAALFQYLFRRAGLDRAVAGIVAEFPTLPPVRVGLASGAEGAFLAANRSAMMVRLRVERFDALPRYLRNELAHVADQLDPAFGYAESELEPPVRERFALLWAAHIDARTEAAGREPLRDAEAWLRRVEAAWPWAGDVRRCFDAFRAAAISHAVLIECAAEPRKFIERFGGAVVKGGATRCPLCRFPTLVWGRLADEVAALVSADYAWWSRADGACGHCAERYEVKAGVW